MIWQRFSSWPFVDKRKLQSPLQFSAALPVLRGQMCCRCSSSWPFVGKRKLQSPLQFSAALRVLRGQRCCRCRSSWPLRWPSVALRGQKEAVAVAVLRGPPCPPWTNVLPLQFFVALRGPSWTKGSCSRRCSSPRPSVSSVDKCVAVAVLRGPPWPFVDKRKLQSPLQFSAALRVLRGQMCCRCSSSWPSVALRGQKEVAVAVAVLRGPPCPPWTNVLPLQFFVALRGGPPCPPWTKGGPSWPFVDKLQSPLQFSAALRVLRGQMCCRCSSSWPFVDKRKLQSPLQFSAALRVLRGQMCCRCSSSWPFVDKRKLQSPLQFSAALRVLRGQMCCRCSSSWPSVALRGQKEVAVAVAVLRGPPCPPWTNVLPLQFFVALRGPSWKKVPPHSPFEDRPNYDLAYLSSDKRQRALVTPPVRGISLSPLPYPLPPAVLAFEAGLRPCEPIRR